MRNILAAENRPIFDRLARDRTLCAFDFDGTLAPIVPQPDAAAMRPSTSGLLAQLAELYPCIILSGRARSDLVPRLNGAQVRRIIGNHGSETEISDPAQENPGIAGWKTLLESHLKNTSGLWVEDKGFSLAVHYRHAGNKRQARKQILQAASGLDGVRVLGGKEVVNLMDLFAPNKGTALAAERDRLGCAHVLIVGDDENDEDAFAIGGDLVGVRVGRKSTSHARFFIPQQFAIDRLLEALIVARLNVPVMQRASSGPCGSGTESQSPQTGTA